MATPNQSSSDEAKTISETLIPELPRERGWETDGDIYLLNGFWYPTWVIHGLVALQQHFKPHPNGFPKSGTTWLKALLFSIVNRATFNHDDMMHPLLNSNPHDLVLWLETYASSNRTNPRPPQSFLFSTHLAYPSLPEQIRSSSCRIVYVFRDPKDVFVSFWHFLNKLGLKESSSIISLQEAFNQFTRGASPYGPYWDHVTSYYKASIQFPNKVFFLRYEDLKTEAVVHVKRLAEFVGWPFSEEEENEGVVQKITDLCSFDKLSNLEVNKNGSLFGKDPSGRMVSVINKAFFRKGEIGDSKNHLSEEMREILDQITDDKFNEIGLTAFVPLV
nr:flavonol sulfotransferase-like [Ipomoea trifida]